MTEFRSDRENMLNVVERRDGSGRFEYREDKANGQIIIEGYAATYDPYDCHGGPNGGGWIEQLSSRAFDDTLASQPDVQLLINHAGTPLARTKSGTLKLTRDQHGLRVWASLDASDPDVQALVPKMRRKDMDEMSFAFRVTDQSWDTTYTNRTINALTLEKGDVSIVNYGMNPGTKAVIADAVGALSQLSNRELVELRKLDTDQVKRAVVALQAIAEPHNQPGLGSIQSQGPIAAFADPGYKTDGKKRYPLDSEGHVRAAWSYINMPKNQTGYTAIQLTSIKDRIQSAAKRHNILISEPEVQKVRISHIEEAYRADGNIDLVAVMSDGARVLLPKMPKRAALLPGDVTPLANTDTGSSLDKPEWNPNDALSEDPHDKDYEVGPMGLVDPAPVPDNIVGGEFPAQIGRPGFHGVESGDPHDNSYSTEELSMDNRNSKLAVASGNGGNSGGGDPHATPFDVSAPCISTSEMSEDTAGNAHGTSGGVNPGEPPSVGTAPVADEGKYDWTTGEGGPGEPALELDHTVRADDPIEIDFGMAEALERTIVHCYKLAEGNTEVRQTLEVARKQLNALLGKTPKPAGPSDIQQRMAEIRTEIGDPNTGNVSDYLKFLRTEGSAPVGYRGLLDTDPTTHVTTPSERLAREAVEAERRARSAAADSDKAAERVKAAQREAELNDAIRRHRKEQ